MTAEKPVRWWSSPRTLLHAILMLDDTRHSIALGTAIGMFVGLTPTVGIQMILVVALSLTFGRVIRFNRLAALITVYISNPITTVPIYWLNYKVGTLFIAGDWTREDFSRIIEYRNLQEWWSTFTKLFVEIGEPLIVGSLVVASIGSVITYPAIMRLLKSVPKRTSPQQMSDRVAVTTESES